MILRYGDVFGNYKADLTCWSKKPCWCCKIDSVHCRFITAWVLVQVSIFYAPYDILILFLWFQRSCRLNSSFQACLDLCKNMRYFPVLEEFVRIGVDHIDAHWHHRLKRQIKMTAYSPAQKINVGTQRDWSTVVWGTGSVFSECFDFQAFFY